MADTKTFKCRFGCGKTVEKMHDLRSHYKTVHATEYEQLVASRPPREKKTRGRQGAAVQAPAEDAETALLFSASALFAETLLPSDGYARVVAYLQQRFAGATGRDERPALSAVG